MEISVKGSVDAIIRDLDAHPATVEKATTMALNKTGATVRARVIRALQERYGLQRVSVTRRLRAVRAYAGRLRFDVVAHPSAPSIAAYNAKQTKAGVRSNAWNRTHVYKHTFIPSGRKVAFKRLTKARLPIKKVYGPSLPKSFGRQEIKLFMDKVVDERFPLEFTRALRALWARKQ